MKPLEQTVGTPRHFWAGMKKHFGINQAKQYMDTLAIMSGRGAGIDILKLDDWLHEKHGNYEDTWGMSMSEFIETEYGKAAHDFVVESMRLGD